ncbi:MAG: serine protease [Planctomycetes bacterium]|nr:serine protease [Planctomycetota bacterium]
MKKPDDRFSDCRAFAEAVSTAIAPGTRRTTAVGVRVTAATQRLSSPEARTQQEARVTAAPRTLKEQQSARPRATIIEQSQADQRQTMKERSVRSTVPSQSVGRLDRLLLGQRNEQPFWRKWLITGAVVFFIAITLTTASVMYLMKDGVQPETVATVTDVIPDPGTDDDPPEIIQQDSGPPTKVTPPQFPKKDKTLSLADLIESLEPAVVRISVELKGGKKFGSGFVIDGKGLIVTNYHVIKGARKATAAFADGTSKKIEGYRLLFPEKDIAILQLAKPYDKLAFIPLAVVLPRKGESVVTLGVPKGLSVSASQGIVSAIRTQSELAELGLPKDGIWIQTTAPILPGNSGGPLVSREGLVIGANTWTVSTGQNRNFAISSIDIRDALESARGNRLKRFSTAEPPPTMASPKPATFASNFWTTPEAFDPTRAKKFRQLWFGADGFDLSRKNPGQLRKLGVKTRKGFYITIVAYGSPAYKAGLRINDIIKSVDRKFISTIDDLAGVVDSAQNGQTLQVEVLKYSTKGGYRPKAVRVSVTVRNVIPQYAIDYVSQLQSPPEVKEFLLLQLLNFGDSLSRASILATQGGFQERALVAKILQQGPFDPVRGPILSEDTFIKMEAVRRTGRVRILQVVGDDLIRFRLGRHMILMDANTTNMPDGFSVDMGVVKIVGTKSYETESGESKNAFVAERFDMRRFLPSEIEMKRMMAIPAAAGRPPD